MEWGGYGGGKGGVSCVPGLKKCSPTKFFGLLDAAAMPAICMTTTHYR